MSRKERRFSPATSLAIRYVAFGMIWILFSDSMLSWISKDSLLWQLAHIHILKGVFFIGVTGAALFYFVHNLHQKLVTKEWDAANLFDHNPHPLISLDPLSLKIVKINEAARYLIDPNDKEIVQDDFSSFLAEADRDRFKHEFTLRHAAMQFRNAGIWCIQMRTGEVMSVRIDVVHFSNDEAGSLILALHNLTPQLTAEKQLREFAQFTEQKIAQRTSHLERRNEELSLRAKETEKVNSELIFINERLQMISRERSTADNVNASAGLARERNPETH